MILLSYLKHLTTILSLLPLLVYVGPLIISKMSLQFVGESIQWLFLFNLFELIIIPTTHACNRSLIFFKNPGRLLDFSVVHVGRGSENFQILFLK